MIPVQSLFEAHLTVTDLDLGRLKRAGIRVITIVNFSPVDASRTSSAAGFDSDSSCPKWNGWLSSARCEGKVKGTRPGL